MDKAFSESTLDRSALEEQQERWPFRNRKYWFQVSGFGCQKGEAQIPET
jgi:hypothetical protein